MRSPSGRRVARRSGRPASRAPFLLAVLSSLAAVVSVACGAQSEEPVVEEQAEPPTLHPAFAVTSDDLENLLGGVPDGPATAIRANPSAFLARLDEVLQAPADLTILVDKDNPLPEDYAPADLVDLDELAGELVLSRAGHRLRHPATEALRQMSAEAGAAGVTLMVSSAYRSYAYQADVYARWVDQLGRAMADRVSARPGMSQHQLGTAVDFGCICREFADQPAGVWLAENAHRFGYSLSYPEGYEEITGYLYEPWHYRYIGRAAAALEHEYFGGIQQYMLEFLARNRASLLAAR